MTARQTNAAADADRDPARVLRDVIDANASMTLATADRDGLPWASPVWFAHRDYLEFVWVSRPDARHSHNVAQRGDIAIVIFDSSVPVGQARAVYIEAEAEQLGEGERQGAIEVYSERSLAHGAGRWTVADITGTAPHRLYRATASARYVLVGGDRRVPVPG